MEQTLTAQIWIKGNEAAGKAETESTDVPGTASKKLLVKLQMVRGVGK